MFQHKICLENIYKEYPGVVALRDITLEIEKDEIVVIIGPSGSGKTTLINIIGLIDKPTKGNIFFDGKSVNNLNDEKAAEIRNRNFGFIFQFFYLLPELNVIENVMLPLWIKEKKN